VDRVGDARSASERGDGCGGLREIVAEGEEATRAA
jgi:hypothetical protein